MADPPVPGRCRQALFIHLDRNLRGGKAAGTSFPEALPCVRRRDAVAEFVACNALEKSAQLRNCSAPWSIARQPLLL
jgi:hypothetical protein